MHLSCGEVSMKRCTSALLLFLLMSVCAMAQAGNSRLSTVHFKVLKSFNGKPVRNAFVVMHTVGKDGKQQRAGMELKTDPDGVTFYEGLPYGKIRIQVLAEGLQTFGEDYVIDKPDMDIVVKLDRPQKQYSVYEEHPAKGDDKKDAPKDDKKNAPATKPATPPAAT